MSEVAKRLLSIPEAREVLGDIGHTTIYELFKRYELVKVNIGRRSFVTAESLAAYVDRLREAASKARDAEENIPVDPMPVLERQFSAFGGGGDAAA